MRGSGAFGRTRSGEHLTRLCALPAIAVALIVPARLDDSGLDAEAHARKRLRDN